MKVPASVCSFWADYQAAVGCQDSERFYEAFHFDDNEQDANHLAELVLGGGKRATASLLWWYESKRKALPEPGFLSVVTDWDGRPLCVIETKMVSIVPFDDVTEAFAIAEGEGDLTLRYWQDAHLSYFIKECEQIGKKPTLQMPVVCEEFVVVYQGAV